MDDKIKQYADTLYEGSLHGSAKVLRDERVRALQEMSARTSVPALQLSGAEIQTQLRLSVLHVERCMEARLESYREAYGEAKEYPTDEEFSEILTSIKDAQRLQINHSAQALREFMKSRGVDRDPTDALTRSSVPGHDRVLADLKVWRGQVHLTRPVRTDDRKFARMAIDEARKSVPENDGIPHPMVGAVVVKNGQVLATAHRGEAEGNHAEYIALEKRLADAAVSGSTVYTTLEPCTTRNHPKIPCVDRLIERKVGRVVIGMLDPDARITGRGQRKLRSANIITDFFPHDLMAEVEELNREFTRKVESASRVADSLPLAVEAQGPSRAVTHKPLPSRISQHMKSILAKLEDPENFGLVRIYCWPRENVEISFSDLKKFVEDHRSQFSEAMRHFPNVDVLQDGVSIGYFPRSVRQDVKSTIRISLYVDGFVAFDALADTFLKGGKQVHSGWLCYEVQRQLQLTKALLNGRNAIQIHLRLDLEYIEAFRLAIRESGSWAEYVPYTGTHRPVTREVSLEEIADYNGDKRNIVMPAVRDIMGEVVRIFGLSQAPSNLWDHSGYLSYVKGLESQR